ncbi:hypothetical protein Lal_00011037 [Lupinus albus]|nr:hypothetical protein Lal_00011037 [Lupinus albus]
MANSALNYYHLFVIVVLLVTGGSMMVVTVEASNDDIICLDSLGACGPTGQCDQRCKTLHNDGVGTCGFNSCTCLYRKNCKPFRGKKI